MKTIVNVMKNEELSRIYEKIYKKEIEENEKDFYFKKYNQTMFCNTIHKFNNKKVHYHCNDIFCKRCQTKKRHKRYNEIKEVIKNSEKFLKENYVETMLTLNFNNDYEKVKNLDLEQYLIYFDVLIKKFNKKIKEFDCSFIEKKEIVYNVEKYKFNVHLHILINIEKENLKKLQKIWREITNENGNLHISFIKNYCNKSERKYNLRRLVNYLSKNYLSVKTSEKEANVEVENIEDKEILEKVIRKIDKTFKNFRCLSFYNIYDIKKMKNKEKQEKSRHFIVKNYNKELFEKEKGKLVEYYQNNENMLFLKYKSNNNTVEIIEKKLECKTKAIKSRKTINETIEKYNFEKVLVVKNEDKKEIENKISFENNTIKNNYNFDFEEIKMLKKSFEEQKKEILEIKKEKENLLKENEELKRQLEILNNKIEETNIKKKKTKKEKVKVKKELKNKEENNLKKEKTKETKNKRVSKIKKIELEKEEIKQEKDKLETENFAKRSEIEKLKKQIEELNIFVCENEALSFENERLMKKIEKFESLKNENVSSQKNGEKYEKLKEITMRYYYYQKNKYEKNKFTRYCYNEEETKELIEFKINKNYCYFEKSKNKVYFKDMQLGKFKNDSFNFVELTIYDTLEKLIEYDAYHSTDVAEYIEEINIFNDFEKELNNFLM